VAPKRRKPVASSARAEENRRRIVEQDLRVAITWFGVLQERRGRLTLLQIRSLSQLLADRADLLYRLADRVERGAAAPRLPKKHGVRQLAARVARLGRADDPVTRAVLAKLAALTEASEQPRTPPRALRGLAIEVLALSEDVATSRVLPRDQPPPPSRGRRPNAPLAWLLDRGTKLGVADVEIARALTREGLEPLGPGSDKTDPAEADEDVEDDEVAAQALADARADLVERWAAIIKSSRARARKRQHPS
jgi:hypothetical protein